MDPSVLTGLISGGASLLGGFMSSSQSAQNVQQQIAAQEMMLGQTQNFNAQQASLNREFQGGQVTQQEQFQQNMMGAQEEYNRGMANTAYQRAAADMKKAGLNPMMMFGSGGAAQSPGVSAPSGSTAGGSTASIGTPSVPLSQKSSPFGGIGEAISKAMDAAVRAKYIDKMSSEIGATQATTDLTAAKTASEKQQQDIRAPDVRSAMIRMGYPDWLANALTYGPDIGKGVSDTAGVLDAVPGFKLLKGLLSGGNAKSLSKELPALSGGAGTSAVQRMPATQRRAVIDKVDELRANSGKAKASARELDEVLSSGGGKGYSDKDFGFVGDGRE